MQDIGFSLGLDRWKQQTVDVWVMHRGIMTELFCGGSGWRIVMAYENPQEDFSLFSLDLKIALASDAEVEESKLLYVGQSSVAVEEHIWKQDELRAIRWGVQSYSNYSETLSEEHVANGIEMRFDIFALLSLVQSVGVQSAQYIHLENVQTTNAPDLLHIWFGNTIDSTAQFLHTLRCTGYTSRANGKCRPPPCRTRFSLILKTALLRQFLALAGCCGAQDFCDNDTLGWWAELHFAVEISDYNNIRV